MEIPGTASGAFAYGAVATASDLSAVAVSEKVLITKSRIYLTMSDGRGLTWTPLLRADEDQESIKSAVQVAIVADQIFVAWRDTRNSGSNRDIYYNVWDTSMGQFLGEQRLDVGFAVGEANHQRFDVASTALDMLPFLHVLVDVESSSGQNVILVTSVGDAIRFEDPMHISPDVSGLAVADIAIAARGLDLHVAWSDDRHGVGGVGFDLFYQRDESAGFGGFRSEDIQLDGDGLGVGNAYNLSMDAHLDRVAVVWKDSFDVLDQSVRCIVSSDGGDTFGPDIKVGSYGIGDDVQDSDVGVDPESGNVLVCWIDNRLEHGGSYAPRVATSVDGLTFGPDVMLADVPAMSTHYSTDVVTGSACEQGSERMSAVSWSTFLFGEPHPRWARVSYDGGLSWEQAVMISEGDPVTSYPSVYNCLYRNFLYAWAEHDMDLDLEGPVRAGGFRGPTLEANGFAPGPATVDLAFEFFEPGSDGLAWALFALSPSDLVAIEGKILGLFPDVLFSSTLLAAVTGDLSSPIDGEGSGMTRQLGTNLPPGVTLYAIGLGLDLSAGFASVGSVTDVLEIQL